MAKVKTPKTGQDDPRYIALAKFMKKWGVSSKNMAEAAGINANTFRFKLMDKYPYRFSDTDFMYLKKAVEKMTEEAVKIGL